MARCSKVMHKFGFAVQLFIAVEIFNIIIHKWPPQVGNTYGTNHPQLNGPLVSHTCNMYSTHMAYAHNKQNTTCGIRPCMYTHVSVGYVCV